MVSNVSNDQILLQTKEQENFLQFIQQQSPFTQPVPLYNQTWSPSFQQKPPVTYNQVSFRQGSALFRPSPHSSKHPPLFNQLHPPSSGHQHPSNEKKPQTSQYNYPFSQHYSSAVQYKPPFKQNQSPYSQYQPPFNQQQPKLIQYPPPFNHHQSQYNRQQPQFNLSQPQFNRPLFNQHQPQMRRYLPPSRKQQDLMVHQQHPVLDEQSQASPTESQLVQNINQYQRSVLQEQPSFNLQVPSSISMQSEIISHSAYVRRQSQESQEQPRLTENQQTQQKPQSNLHQPPLIRSQVGTFLRSLDSQYQTTSKPKHSGNERAYNKDLSFQSQTPSWPVTNMENYKFSSQPKFQHQTCLTLSSKMANQNLLLAKPSDPTLYKAVKPPIHRTLSNADSNRIVSLSAVMKQPVYPSALQSYIKSSEEIGENSSGPRSASCRSSVPVKGNQKTNNKTLHQMYEKVFYLFSFYKYV